MIPIDITSSTTYESFEGECRRQGRNIGDVLKEHTDRQDPTILNWDSEGDLVGSLRSIRGPWEDYVLTREVDSKLSNIYLRFLRLAAEEARDPVPAEVVLQGIAAFRVWMGEKTPVAQKNIIDRVKGLAEETLGCRGVFLSPRQKFAILQRSLQEKLLLLRQSNYQQFAASAGIPPEELLNIFLNFPGNEKGKLCLETTLRELKTSLRSFTDPETYLRSPHVEYRVLAMAVHLSGYSYNPDDPVFSDRASLVHYIKTHGAEEYLVRIFTLSQKEESTELQFLIAAELERLGYFSKPILMPKSSSIRTLTPERERDVRAVYEELGRRVSATEQIFFKPNSLGDDPIRHLTIPEREREISDSDFRDVRFTHLAAFLEEELGKKLPEFVKAAIGRDVTKREAWGLLLDIPFIKRTPFSPVPLSIISFQDLRENIAYGFTGFVERGGPYDGKFITLHGSTIAKELAEKIKTSAKGVFRTHRREETYSYLLGGGSVYTGNYAIARVYAKFSAYNDQAGILRFVHEIPLDAQIGWQSQSDEYQIINTFYSSIYRKLFRDLNRGATSRLMPTVAALTADITPDHLDNHASMSFLRDSRSSSGGLHGIAIQRFQIPGGMCFLPLVGMQESHACSSEGRSTPIQLRQPKVGIDFSHLQDWSTNPSDWTVENLPQPSFTLHAEAPLRDVGPSIHIRDLPLSLPAPSSDLSGLEFYALCDALSAKTGKAVHLIFQEALLLSTCSERPTAEEIEEMYRAVLGSGGVARTSGLFSSFANFSSRVGASKVAETLAYFADLNKGSIGGQPGLQRQARQLIEHLNKTTRQIGIDFEQYLISPGLQRSTSFLYMGILHSGVSIKSLGIPSKGVSGDQLASIIQGSADKAKILQGLSDVYEELIFGLAITDRPAKLDFLMMAAVQAGGVLKLNETLPVATGAAAGAGGGSA